MRRNFTIQNAVITTVSSMNTAHKTMSSINFVKTNVLTLFLLFCFWQTGMGQSIFLPGNPPTMGEAPVGINIPPAPGIDFHVNGNIRFQGLPNITLANSFLAMDVVGNIFHQTGSLPLLGTALGQSLYWSGTHWQPTSFLHIDPVVNFVGIGTNTPLFPAGADFESDPAGGWIFNPTPMAPRFSVLGDITTPNNIFCHNVYVASDRRLKENITELPDWKRVLDIQAYTYKYIGQEHDAYSFGFLAQDVNRVIPELTSLWGNAGAVNYIGFIPFLTQGLQDHEERLNTIEQGGEIPNEGIEELKVENGELKVENQILNKKVENLDNKVETLENRNEDLKRENQVIKSRLTALEEKFNAICNLPCIQNPTLNNDGFGLAGILGELPTLEQNEPNPFTETTVIRFFVPENVKGAKIEVKNTEGKTVGDFSVQSNGQGSITLKPGYLSAGTYYYSLIIEDKITDTKKMILLN